MPESSFRCRSFAAIFVALMALLASSAAHAADRPNILWITSEDNGVDWISCYGGTNADTPNIDQLAKEGFRYTHCFDNAAVCAPTRSCWITGMYAIPTALSQCAVAIRFRTIAFRTIQTC